MQTTINSVTVRTLQGPGIVIRKRTRNGCVRIVLCRVGLVIRWRRDYNKVHSINMESIFSYTSYCVIHGRMNSHSTIGRRSWTPLYLPVKKTTHECNPTIKAIDTEGMIISSEHYNAVVTESLSLLGKESDTIVLLYSAKGIHACTSLDSIKVVQRVGRMFTIWICPDGKNHMDTEHKEDSNNDHTSLSHVYTCSEEDILQSATSKEGYSALIVDHTVPSDLVTIREGIFAAT